MKVLRSLMLACVAALAAGDAFAQADLRAPLPQPLKIKQGMLNVPALSPLWLLPEEAAKYNIQIEMVMFQRFSDARTALVSGDLQLTAFGPQDISLALGQGAKSLVGVAGVGHGQRLPDRAQGRGHQGLEEHRRQAHRHRRRLDLVAQVRRRVSGERPAVQRRSRSSTSSAAAATTSKALQGKEIDLAVVWHPFCAQAIVDGFGAYPTLDHNRSKTVGGLISVLAVNRPFMEKNRDAVQSLVISYIDVLELARKDTARWAKIYAEKAGLPENVAAESIRTTQLDHAAAGVHQAHLEVPVRQRRHHARRVGRDRAVLHYDFLAKATGKSPEQLGLKQ